MPQHSPGNEGGGLVTACHCQHVKDVSIGSGSYDVEVQGRPWQLGNHRPIREGH